MSWFGETFGDSLSSLKGQITKITKEVLADDEAVGNSTPEPDILVKEFQALCESKDLEIASLRDELCKLQTQYKCQHETLTNENKQKKSVCDGDLKELEEELNKVKEERDHLNSCIDALQSEYQINLNQVILIRDAYKTELDELKNEYSSLKHNFEENLKKNLSEKEELILLKSKIQQLEVELEGEKKNLLVRESESVKVSNQEVEKLLGVLQTVNKDKQEIEEKYAKIKFESEDLKNKLVCKEKEAKENEIKLRLLINEKEELIEKCKQTAELEQQLSDLKKMKSQINENLNSLLDRGERSAEENDIFTTINLIENELKSNQINEEKNLEIIKMKKENEDYKNNLKISMDKWSEAEKKYEEEILSLRKSLSELKTQQQDCINQSQTDDVKRLEQELSQFMSLLLVKNNEISDYSRTLKSLEQELKVLKTSSMNSEEELSILKKEKTRLEEEIQCLKIFNNNISQEKNNLEETLKTMHLENSALTQTKNQLEAKITQLENQIATLNSNNNEIIGLHSELDKIRSSNCDLEKLCQDLKTANASLKNEFENSKAQVIVKESSIGELMKANAYFQEEMNKLQAQNNEIVTMEKEIKKWKDASVDLEIQRQDVIAKKEALENECLSLRSQLELLAVKDAEIQQLSLANATLAQSCNQLHYQLESKVQMEHSLITKDNELEEKCQKQSNKISELEEENNELKSRIRKFQEQMKVQLENQILKDDVQQHRRSKSAVEFELCETQKGAQINEGTDQLQETLKQEQIRIRSLQQQLQEMSDKEANARKEFERLKQHLLEVEDHYTEEAVENGKIINDLKSKLITAEEQLQNSSTLYTSLKVRDSQHVESLQNQLRMISAQRDDFQAKVSAAEDEIQKHKASLMSLQIVLEQFQEDKKQEIEEVAMKCEKQLQQANSKFRDFETEIEGLKKQLIEAKTGLKAASRLGEQLEKKTQQVSELEESVSFLNGRVKELEEKLNAADQINNGKIEKSLIKNLMIGYILSPNGERKSQVLKIIASILDFNQEERDKMGVDATHSGWLANILHPKGGGPPSSQSLSEAFIKFLENESRPQPQLKLFPEQAQSGSSKTSPKPGRLPELLLPTFNSTQENESSIILKNVLKDS